MLLHFLANADKKNIYKIEIEKLINIIDFEVSSLFDIKINVFYEISFLSRKKSLLLNQKYRNKNYVADVISIPFWEEESNFWFENIKKKNIRITNKIITPLLGEIYLCLWKIKQHAVEYGVSFISELSRMIIHGILHLLEFDHEISSTMEYITLEIQDKINLNVANRYKNAK